MTQRQMLINYVPGEECRIALVEDGRLDELYHERASRESHIGNIYKGRVTNVEPSIQAAFVDFGLERNGFLHITDVHPMYFPGDHREETERVGHKTPHRERPPIQRCLRRGQEVLVQVIKEGIGTKGPTLTSYLSIPGRYLVMMPHMERHGVSRKVEDDDVRRQMKQILDELDPPAGFGFIVRTAGLGRTKSDLKRDLAYLQRLWRTIDSRRHKVRVGELYTEADLITRTLRDLYSSDVDRIIIDHESAARRARDFLRIFNPRTASPVSVYQDTAPLFDRFGIEKQIESIHARQVPLPSGGSLVIDPTEALVAIDVNSGKMREHGDAETTAYKTNMEAVDEICRQLRLRDLGGVIVNDLIDMRDPRHRRAVEGRMRDNLKRDRAKTRTLPINGFGILAMTRQRMGPSLNSALYARCTACDGRGSTRNPESVVLAVMRQLALAMCREQVARIELTISPDVAFQLLNRRRQQLVEMERQHDVTVVVRVHGSAPVDEVILQAYDGRGGIVNLTGTPNLGEPTLVSVDELLKQAGELDEPVEVDDLDEGDEQPASSAAPEAEAKGVAGEEEAQPEGGRKRRRRRRRRKGGSDSEAAGSTATTESAADAELPASSPMEEDEADVVPAEARTEVEAQSVADDAAEMDAADAGDDVVVAEVDEYATDDADQQDDEQASLFDADRAAAQADDENNADEAASPEDASEEASSAESDGNGENRKRRRRRRRRGRGGGGQNNNSGNASADHTPATSSGNEPAAGENGSGAAAGNGESSSKRRRRRRRRGGGGGGGNANSAGGNSAGSNSDHSAPSTGSSDAGGSAGRSSGSPAANPSSGYHNRLMEGS